ncbi:MAG: hypothetical protein KA787_05835 [Bacteroidia bacterium]|nr:hypothetical protein [Bacteroidia bacterium]MBP7773096.1 hypothetical protein [Bacteroidia bacterium]
MWKSAILEFSRNTIDYIPILELTENGIAQLQKQDVAAHFGLFKLLSFSEIICKNNGFKKLRLRLTDGHLWFTIHPFSTVSNETDPHLLAARFHADESEAWTLYAGLTDREKWLLRELAQGSNTVEILKKANITANTFRVHRRHLLAKTRKISLRQLREWARRFLDL